MIQVKNLHKSFNQVEVLKGITEEIRDGDVVFSYKLLEGPATTRNAIRLLGLAGYDEEVVERARARAERFETTGNWT